MSKNAPVSYKTISQADAEKLLSESRGGGGGRRSKYSPVLDAAEKLTAGKALHLSLSRIEAQGLRQALRKRLGETHKMRTSAIQGSEGQFHVVVMHAA